MTHEPQQSPAGTEREFDPILPDNEIPALSEGDEFADIPTISPDMLHHDRVEFEAGMNVIPAVTLLLMLACIAIYGRQVWVGGLANHARVVATGAMDRSAVQSGEIWRLISGGFMHASAGHLIGNMIILFIL